MKLNGLHLSKKYIPSAKTLYTEDLSNITFNYLCKNSPNFLCHFWNHNSFFTQFVCIILSQTLHTIDKNIPSKCKFSDFSLLELKFMKFIMSFYKQKVSFASRFGSLFSVMRDSSSALCWLKLCMLLTKVVHHSENFKTCICSH